MFLNKTGASLYKKVREQFETAIHKLDEALQLNDERIGMNTDVITNLSQENTDLNVESQKIKQFKFRLEELIDG